MTPPTIARVLRRCDVGSLTGGQGQRIADPLGGGLDGVPDLQRVQLEGFENQTARQFNGAHRLLGDGVGSRRPSAPTSCRSTPTRSTRRCGATRRARSATSRRSAATWSGTLLWTRTLSPTMLNEARFNVTRWYFDEIASNPEQPWGLPRLWVNQPVGTENPLVSYGPGIGPGVFYQTTYNFRDTLTKVINTHALKIRRRHHLRAEQRQGAVGRDAGIPLRQPVELRQRRADSTRSRSSIRPTARSPTSPSTPAPTTTRCTCRTTGRSATNLTVNAGLRWEYFSPLQSKNDQHLEPDPRRQRRARRRDSCRSAAISTRRTRTTSGRRSARRGRPGRFGGKTVVRGGFGVAYNRLPGSRLLESRFNPPFFAGFTLTGSNVAYRSGERSERASTTRTTRRRVLTFDPVTGLPSSGAAGQRQRDRAGDAEPVHLPLLGRHRVRDRPRLGGARSATRGARATTSRARCPTSCSSRRTRGSGT